MAPIPDSRTPTIASSTTRANPGHGDRAVLRRRSVTVSDLSTDAAPLDPRSRGELRQVLDALAGGVADLARLLSGWHDGPQAAATPGGSPTVNASGDSQASLDLLANQLFIDALRGAPVCMIASEEADDPIAMKHGASLAVAIDPLDGSSNIEINGSIGTIFSVIDATGDRAEQPFVGDGSRIVASGLALYGPRTILAVAVGDRVGVWRLAGLDRFGADDDDCRFEPIDRPIVVAPNSNEYAINASNARHWPEPIRRYIDDLLAGSDGPRGLDANTRWVAAVVADAFRILERGGIYLYPADTRPRYRHGRLRLLYEGHPIAYLIEAAGGAATDGEHRLLDQAVIDIHQHSPLVFGSRNEVASVARYLESSSSQSPFSASRSPLFKRRGLLRGS